MRSDPPISVVMPVHNALPHLDAAVQCILDQTFRDFEFVIYDDASTDGSRERLCDWAKRDSRIRLFEGARNLGPVGSSTFIVKQSTAPLVARMDADDLCSPDRLERQFQLLRENPQAGLAGTLFEVIDASGRVIRGPEIWRLKRKTAMVPFAHGAILFRRSLFDQAGGYRDAAEFWEDQDLIVRMAEVSEVLVIPSPLYQVRQWTKSTRSSSDRARVENAVDLMYRCVARLEQGRPYDDLLRVGEKPSRVDPRVFIAAGSIVLWSGERPRMLGRLLTRGKLQPNFRTMTALVWTAWASINPGSLRIFMKLLLRSKNRLADHELSASAPFRWSPRKTSG